VGGGEGTGVCEGVSPVSPSVALLALLKKESEDCGIAGLITLAKHAVITTRVPIACQLRLLFIVILLTFFIRFDF